MAQVVGGIIGATVGWFFGNPQVGPAIGPAVTAVKMAPFPRLDDEASQDVDVDPGSDQAKDGIA